MQSLYQPGPDPVDVATQRLLELGGVLGERAADDQLPCGAVLEVVEMERPLLGEAEVVGEVRPLRQRTSLR